MTPQSPMGAPAPIAPMKRKHSESSIKPLFTKKEKPIDAATTDPLNVDIYLLRKEHDLEWENIAVDLNVRFNRGVGTNTTLLSAGACYSRFAKHAEDIARSRGEAYRREWYIAEAHNRASLAVDAYTLNETIYLLRKQDDKSWEEITGEINRKFQLDGTRAREPLTVASCSQRFKNNAASIASARGEAYEKEWYTGPPRHRKIDHTVSRHSSTSTVDPGPRKLSQQYLPTKVNKIKTEPVYKLNSFEPIASQRRDSDVIVAASRPVVKQREQRSYTALATTASAVASRPVASREQRSKSVSTTNPYVVAPRPVVHKRERNSDAGPATTQSGTMVAAASTTQRVEAEKTQAKDKDNRNNKINREDLVAESYKKVKAKLWKDVSELVSFKSNGMVQMTEEQCREVMFGRKSSL